VPLALSEPSCGALCAIGACKGPLEVHVKTDLETLSIESEDSRAQSGLDCCKVPQGGSAAWDLAQVLPASRLVVT
jgi:hypothetical protein